MPFHRRDELDLSLLELARPEGAANLGRALTPLETGDRDRFIDAVEHHRLAASLLDACRRSGLHPPPHIVELTTASTYNRLRIGQVLAQTKEALGTIPWVACKGPTIGWFMQRPELRGYNDLDILVSGRFFGEAITALKEAGIVELNQNWTPYVRHGIGEVPMLAGDVFIDLHWHLVALARGRRHLRVDPLDMLDRRTHAEYSTYSIPVLDLEDQLLHVTLHCALSGATRLDQLRDLAVVAAAGPDWNVFADRAERFGVAHLTAQALDRSRQLLAAEIPEGITKHLGGRGVRLRQIADGRSVLALRRFPVAVQRDWPTATLYALAQTCRDGVRHLTGRDTNWDFTDERSELFYGRPSGNRRTRAEFLDYVASGV